MNAIAHSARPLWLTFDQIDLPENGRPTNATDVVALSRSIRAIGLQVPLTCVEREGRHLLIAGRHRLEALRVLGYDKAPVHVGDFDDIEARLCTISENLHRTELSALQRSEQIAEFAKLTQERLETQKQVPVDQGPARLDPAEQYIRMGGKMPRAKGGDGSDKVAQLAPVSKGGCPGGDKPAQLSKGGRGLEGGDRLVGRELNISRREIERSKAIAALPDAVKAKATELGLADNQSALLQAAKAPPEAQVETLARRAEGPGQPSAKPLRNLENLLGGELARWIKITTPNDRPRVIRMLRMAADILEDELEAK